MRKPFVLIVFPLFLLGLAQPALGQGHFAVAGLTRINELRCASLSLASLHERLPPPSPGEWRYENREPEQTFAEYDRDTMRERVTARRRILYLQPVGRFDEKEWKNVQKTATFLRAFFHLPVRLCKPTKLYGLPRSTKRFDRQGNVAQLRVEPLLKKVLQPALPADAAGLMAITGTDLHPGPAWGMNYVFGMAWLYGRVGVVSTNRLGTVTKGGDAEKKQLLRTLKLTVHETAHLFSIRHSTTHLCGMNGRRGQLENERSPLWFCHEAAAKVCLATGADPESRYANILRFCTREGLRKEATYYRKALQTLRDSRRTWTMK